MAMHNAVMTLQLERADHDLRSVERKVSLPGWAVKVVTWSSAAFSAYQLGKMARKLSDRILDITELTRLVEEETRSEPIDNEGRIGRHLEESLDFAKIVHGKALNLRHLVIKNKRSLRLAEACDQLVAIAAEYHEAIARFSWAILEHDSNCAGRREGFSGNTQQDVLALLDRISAGE